MQTNTYFSIHNHTDMSNAALGFSDCINKVEDLIQYAYDIGLTGVCITDHECISGYVQALNYYNKMQKDRPFVLGLGNECYLLTKEEYESNLNNETHIPFYHFVLLALDTEGYHQICQLTTRAWERAWSKGVWRRPTLYEDLEEIVKPNKGHIVASTACLGSRIDKLLLEEKFSEAIEEVERLVDIFGKDNIYIECQPAKDKDSVQCEINFKLWELADKTNTPIIATTDSHYLKKEQSLIHKVFLQSQNGEREVDDFYATAYMQTAEELKEKLSINFDVEKINRIFEETNVIATRIKEYDIFHNPIIPQIPTKHIPSFYISHRYRKFYDKYPSFMYYSGWGNEEADYHESYFFFQVEQGLKAKVEDSGKNVEEYIARLELEWNELKKISEALNNSMVSYYSTMAELINIMWDVGSFVGVGRGSSAGFLTTYLLDITQVDPVPLGDYLPYWRHVALERGAEIADIDTDSEPCKKYAIIDAVKDYFGEDKVLNVATFGTVSSKTAIERACKGLGISDDIAGYLKSLVPINRGKIADLKDCLYGKGSVGGFKAEFDKYPHLEECALGICGLICQRGIHAAGLCISNEPYINYLGAMKAPNGVMCTAFNLWDSEAVSLVKFDLLTVEALQKMHKAMDAMLSDGVIEWQGSIRATYNKYFHPDVIDYKTPEMWESITKMYSCFQWETPIGVQAINRIKPNTVMDLSAGNSLIRLMPEGRTETPLETYVRYKEHPEEWEKEATEYGLTEEEKAVIREYCGDAYYLADCQEKIMRLSQDKRVAGYGLKESNKLRKSIAKKDPRLQAESKAQFFEWGAKLGTREIFLKYVWEVLFSASFGYSFSSIHSYVYSIIALQELNMYYHYNPVYWNVGCLQSESSVDEDGSGGNMDYGKIAKAIHKIQNYGIHVSAPSINHSNLDFTADAKNNRIFYGIAGIAGINAQIAEQIISNRPYNSFTDFYNKNNYDGSLVTASKFVQLIKAGCFDEFCDNRVRVMKTYVALSTNKQEKLTMANIASIKSVMKLPKAVFAPYNFYKYVCSKKFLYSNHPVFKSKKIYFLDERSTKYFNNNCRHLLKENTDYWYENDKLVVVDKSLEKIFSPAFETIKEYINSVEFLKEYNTAILRKKYNEICPNQNANHWAFEATSYYSQEHELKKMDLEKYNIDHYSNVPSEPVFLEKTFKGRSWREYELNAIAGTIISKDDTHHFFTILTVDDEVVNCKLTQGAYAHYKAQLSEVVDGKNEIIEKSWIARGNLIIVCGYRKGEDFVCKKYKNSIYRHQLQKINCIREDGSADIQTERWNPNEGQEDNSY